MNYVVMNVLKKFVAALMSQILYFNNSVYMLNLFRR